MKLLGTWFLGLFGLLALSSCGLFGPERPYSQGDRRDPLDLDRNYPEEQEQSDPGEPKPIDYLMPWRLARYN